jgi:hypothetical protein
LKFQYLDLIEHLHSQGMSLYWHNKTL